MRLNTSPKSISFSLKLLSAAVVSALMFGNASAAGLGKLTVLSGLGQPLRAEVELTAVGPDESGLLNPKLASLDAFRKANIDFNPALRSLHFAVEQRGGNRQVISITSVTPISDPFVDLLLEVGGNSSSHLVREYTFLLDPTPDLQNNQAPEVSGSPRPLAPLRSSQSTASQSTASQSPAPTRTQTEEPPAFERPAQTARIPRAPQERPIRPAATPQPAPAQNAAQQGDYKVKSGDTLSKIAGRIKPDGVSLDQMLVALFRANQAAFIGNNMNRLRAGQVLSVPDAGTAGAIGNGEAHGVIVAQTSDFNSYRNKLAGQVVNTEAQKSTEPRQSASGKITAKVEEKATAATEAKDKLKLSKAGVPGEKGSKIAPGEEDKIAKEKAIAEANERVKQLEKNVNDLQKLLEVKNKSLADQQKADAAKPAVKPAATPAPAPVAAAATPAASAPAPVPAAEVAKPEVKPEVKPATPVVAATPPAGPRKPKPRPIPPPETSLLDDVLGVLGNPLVWGSLTVLLLSGGAFGIYSGYRKRKEKSFGDSIITDSSLKANSLFGSTGGQSVDTNNSVFNSNFAPSASQLDSNEVDPVAEADVYIAYGRDAQAEEILKEALRTQPDRNAVRVKLLEIYANRKDVRSFEVMASELYGMTKGEGEDWQQAASLGLTIDPKNPLYAIGNDAHEKTVVIARPIVPPQEPDLDDLASDTHSKPSMKSQNTSEEAPYFDSTTLGRLEPDTVARHSESQPKSQGGDLPLDVNTSLDFDLDGMDAEAIEIPEVVEPKPVAAAAAAPAEPEMDFGNIDFDFIDADSKKADQPVANADEVTQLMPAMKVPAEPHLPEVAAHEHAPASAQALDFDLSGITLELGQADKPAPTEAKAAEHSFDLNVPEIASMDFHAPEIHAPEIHAPEIHAPEIHTPEIHAPEIHAPEIHASEIHAPEIHAPEFHAPETLAAHVPAMDFDLSDDSHHAPATNVAPAHGGPALDLLPDMMPPIHSEAEIALDTDVDHEYSNNAEMATKLDLAVAYQEIGDKEGARELLEEVIQGGVPEHAEKAKVLLAKMG
ncbi:MAG: FimV/HubP family polar landmark protein [Burkholderiaceae bacterium]|nr:FimV/HubP family polar landmark protein [Burkholderiaceae bacterium]